MDTSLISRGNSFRNDQVLKKLSTTYPDTSSKRSLIVFDSDTELLSRHSLSIATYYGLNKIINRWQIGDMAPTQDTLILTTDTVLIGGNINVMSLKDTLKLVRPGR